VEEEIDRSRLFKVATKLDDAFDEFLVSRNVARHLFEDQVLGHSLPPSNDSNHRLGAALEMQQLAAPSPVQREVMRNTQRNRSAKTDAMATAHTI
jgi:hypothetical protein